MDSEAQRLETAVEEGRFAAVPELSAAYRKALLSALAQAANPSHRLQILQKARQRLHVSLQLTKARRANLAAATAQAAIFDLSHRPLHTWQIEG